jgi:hypothetical protein
MHSQARTQSIFLMLIGTVGGLAGVVRLGDASALALSVAAGVAVAALTTLVWLLVSPRVRDVRETGELIKLLLEDAEKLRDQSEKLVDQTERLQQELVRASEVEFSIRTRSKHEEHEHPESAPG